jgi:beta-lactamase class A
MRSWPRSAALLVLFTLVLQACSTSQAVAPTLAPTLVPTTIPTVTPIPSPTPLPSPTPVPTFAAGSQVGGVDIGGLTFVEAREALEAAFAEDLPSLKIQAGEATITLQPDDLGLRLPLEAMLQQAATGLAEGRVVDLPFEPSFDPRKLRVAIEELATEVRVPPELVVLSDTETLSRTFAYTPGQGIDVEAAIKAVSGRLADPTETKALELELVTLDEAPEVSMEQLEAEIKALAATWKGVTGLYLYDLASGEEIKLNADSVFAGASTIKVAIMLNAYANLSKFTSRQEFWMGEMIRYSDNLSANDLMAAAAGGTSTEYAFDGAEQMSAMLAELGLKNTYLYVPYESGDYIRQNKVKYKCGPRDPVGPKPYTETGCALRTTPYEMAQIYRYLDACANDEGPLLTVSKLLTSERCQDMLDRLATNADKKRFVSGLPKGTRVEHKSGWIENMQADVGIIRSPGGDVVLSVYLYRPLPEGVYLWSDEYVAPYLGAFAGLVYSAYNPVELTESVSR